MRLLVTGGAGFIGSNFIKHILSSHTDYRVINLDKLTYAGNLENLADVAGSSRYSLIKGDICDKSLINDIEFDAIVNFAAESHVDRSILDAQPFLNTNILGTYNLLEIARQRNCLYLHVSTDEVYGSIKKGLFHEDSPLMPNSPYAASKASSDLLVRAYVETHKIKAIITRCSNNFGPYQFPEKLIPLVILNAMNEKKIPVYGDGLNVRDWIYVLDHCNAIDMILHQGNAGEIYNVGSKNEQTNINVIKLILRKISVKKNKKESELMDLITFVKDRKGHDRRYAIDSSKIEHAIGWKPDHSFENGIEATIDWYMENSKWWQRIISGEYLKYYSIQYGEELK